MIVKEFSSCIKINFVLLHSLYFNSTTIVVIPRNGRHTGTNLLVAEGKELVTADPWFAISLECTYSFCDIVSSCS